MDFAQELEPIGEGLYYNFFYKKEGTLDVIPL
jgi:hypothetical protein